ncbi:MAG: hypothetical protein ACXABK_00900 [Candidatus Heimdallarchaeaceae archaeon]|jgi:hypothetical protein
MKSKDFMSKQLEYIAQTIEWALHLIPEQRLFKSPPHDTDSVYAVYGTNYFGRWSAMRIFYHLVHYEELFALPALKVWLGDELIKPVGIIEAKEFKKEVDQGIILQDLIDRFYAVRKKQIEVIKEIKEEEWVMPKANTFWGNVSAKFIVAKSIQHTLEHGNKIMRNAIFWERSFV